MPFAPVGLDGTPSCGQYVMGVRGKDTLVWRLTEWHAWMPWLEKLEMKGEHKRAS